MNVSVIDSTKNTMHRIGLRRMKINGDMRMSLIRLEFGCGLKFLHMIVKVVKN